MIRSLLCCAALVGAASALRAGELDGDKAVPKAVAPTSATELDGESPTAAHRRGGWGYGGGYRGGYGGGWGYGGGFGRGYSVGYGGGWGGGYSNY